MYNFFQGLRHVGGNIMAKPKEFAHKLRHRFGSADNLPTLVEKEPAKESKNPMGSSSLPRDNPGSRGPAMFVAEHQSSYDEDEAVSRFRSTVASEKSDATSESVPPGNVLSVAVAVLCPAAGLIQDFLLKISFIAARLRTGKETVVR